MLKKVSKRILLIALAMCMLCSYQVGCYASETVIKKFNVTFYANGGTGETVKKKISYTKSNGSDKVIDEVTFSKKGYSFYSWNTKADGKGDKIATVKQAASKVESGKTLKLYAQWGKKIVFKANGGSGKMTSQVVALNKKTRLKENEFTRNGYTFVGWNTKEDGSGTNYLDCQYVKNPKNKLTLYAQWKVNKYYVSYNANGGKGTMDVQKFTYGKKTASKLNRFSRVGYTFDGWNTKADGKGKSYKEGAYFTKLTSVNKKRVTLYAQWKPITFKVYFDPAVNNGCEGYSCNVTYGVFSPAEWNKCEILNDGYKLVSWNTKSDGSGKKIDVDEDISKLCSKDGEEITLYAQWEEADYSITYFLNGGENAPENPTHYCISDGAVEIINPTREGYTFVGWAINEYDAEDYELDPAENEWLLYKHIVLPIPDEDITQVAEDWELHDYRDLKLYAYWTENN